MAKCDSTKNTSSITTTLLAKEHIEEIRAKKFSIGSKDENPLTQDLHRAVTSLSAELYTKDVHFLMELIQNAEDNEYEDDVEPTLEFVFIKKDITGSGAPASLLIFNNEVGFSKKDMASICSVARSTKKGKRAQGFIGEKGIGFKSVFLVSKVPHIVSNGYKVKFSEEPDNSCGIGYIVPQWVADKSFVSKIHGVYGLSRIMPTTTIVLPLKPEKIEPVREQLSQLHPELLLFLSKIKKLNIRSSNSYYKDPTDVCAVSLSHETDYVVIRSKKADSRVVHLSVDNKSGSSEEACRYYIWRQSFPVRADIQARGREDVKEWIISLAFPFGERLTSGTSSAGIFAFLPTRMVTNFPFIIQADFLLASSRESILLDSKWNLQILKCVPTAFVNAFTSFVKEGTPLFSAAEAFNFLPTEESQLPELNDVRESIRLALREAKILPCETFHTDLRLCKPLSAVRILSDFRKLLICMKEKGVSLDGLASLKNYPVHASLEMEGFDEILDFLGVAPVAKSCSWYEKCITSCKLLSQASDVDYMEMLRIFGNNEDIFAKAFFMKNHLFKYIDKDGVTQLCSASKTKKDGSRIWYAMEPEVHSWLNTCNLEFKCPGNMYFLPCSTEAALVADEQHISLVGWLSSHAKIESCSAYGYCSSLCNYLSSKLDQDLLLKFTHFIYHSFSKGFLSETDLSCLTVYMPIIDGLNTIRPAPHKILVCEEGSKWVKLFGPRNPFSEHAFYDLGAVYSASGQFAGEYTPPKTLTGFLSKHSEAVDLPHVFPPNVGLAVASSELTSEQAFMLLDWIKYFRTRGTAFPAKFIASVRDGKWIKTYSGYNSPSKCVLLNETGKRIFEMTSCVLGDFSVLDERYYENRTNSYSEELSYVGVTLGLDDLQTVAMKRFAAAATSEMTKICALSLLIFMGFLKERKMLDEKWMRTLREGRWLRTSKGSSSPNRSVFLLSETDSEAVSILTSLPVVERSFYGSKFETFSPELALLGIKFEPEVYDLVTQRFVFPATPASITSSCGLFILNCIRRLQQTCTATGLIDKVKDQPWLKTSIGFKCPVSTVFPVPTLGCLLSIVEVPIVDEEYYGNTLCSYSNELKSVGVALDFDSGLKIVVEQLRVLLASSKLSPANIISLLQGIKAMLKTMPTQVFHLCEGLAGEALFKTRHGYHKPSHSILSNHSWASVSLFVDLPTIDDSYYGFEIYDYKYELEALGVIVGLEEGAAFVAKGLKRPIKAGQMTAEGAFTLLQALHVLLSQPNEQHSLETFLRIIMTSEFLRTTRGDRTPKQCILLQPQWKDVLQCIDLTFLDDTFYGNRIFEYQSELKRIGVKVDEMEVSHALSESLYSLSETSSIKQYYRFFLTSWIPEDSDRAVFQVWIPDLNVSGGGRWVSSEVCIVHDRDDLFRPFYHCLDNYYEDELLPVFSRAFGVAEIPVLSHYMCLYDSWLRRDNHELTTQECCAFWGYILENWNSATEEILKKNMTKLPAMSSNCTGIQLVSKESLFFPDDLLLRNMFMSLDKCPPFVWLPRGSISADTPSVRLSEVYGFLGVISLSKAVELRIRTLPVQGTKHYLRSKVITRELIKLLLCYLASSKVNMALKSRHEAVRSVLNLTVSECSGPIDVIYRLLLPEGEPVEVKSQKLVHWERQENSLLIETSSYNNRKISMEFGSHFSQELAEGLLIQENEKPVVISDLQKIIQLGLVYDFEQDAVEFLLTRENLELFPEDEKFLVDAFPSQHLLVEAGSSKRLCPITPEPRSKKLRL